MILILLTIFTTLAHGAMPVHIDVNSFAGIYNIDQSTYTSGSQTFVLDSGDHFIMFANNARIYFHLDTSGMVTSYNSLAATGSLGHLRMNTVTVSIDPKNYSGLYSLYGSTLHRGPAQEVFVKGVENRLTTDVGGVITKIFPSDEHLDASSNNVVIDAFNISFKTRTLTVQPRDFKGQYMLGDWTAHSGTQKFVIIENAHHRLRTIENGTIANFHVDDTGVVHFKEYGHSNLIAAHDSVAFKTRYVHINPKKYSANYVISGMTLNGVKRVALIEDAVHRISTDFFTTVSDIQLSGSNIIAANPEAISTSGTHITFSTQTVTVNPPVGYNEVYSLDGYGVFVGPQTLTFIKNVQFALRMSHGPHVFKLESCPHTTAVATERGDFRFPCTYKLNACAAKGVRQNLFKGLFYGSNK